MSGYIVVGNSNGYAFAYDLAAASPRMIDLGTLPGNGSSSAVTVSGTIVVGNTAQSAVCGERDEPGCVPGHAFVYDLGAKSPKMRDIGTLGGSYSQATAMSGNIVVGTSQTATGQAHAFVYDLGAKSPKMRDLGTLGVSSQATAVSGKMVVGSWRTADGYDHAFVYDLGAKSPEMIDLGIPPGSFDSSAVAVSGNIVAVNTVPPRGLSHAFAYDFGTSPPKVVDLGSLGGPNNVAMAMAVSGNIIVGMSETAGLWHPYHAFAYDLGAASPKMIDLGSFYDRLMAHPVVTVSGSIVVGGTMAAVGTNHAFVYDLGAAAPKMRDLGTLGGGYSQATAISGNIAVGSSTTTGNNDVHAVAWNVAK